MVRIITLWQPWASLVAYGLKQYETRSWATSYRGKILIHAGKKWDRKMLNEVISQPALNGHMPEGMKISTGVVVAIADLVDCVRMMPDEGYAAPWEIRVGSVSPLELAVGDWSPGRYAWKLENVQRLEHEIEWKGGQGLRNAPPQLIAMVEGPKR